MTTSDNDFLGRWWVPTTLLAVAISVAGMVLMGWVGPAFLTASAMVAMSITTRLTWDKRSHPRYLRAIVGLIAVQVLIVTAVGPHVQRNAGAIFMLGALIEAIIMTFLLRSTLKL